MNTTKPVSLYERFVCVGNYARGDKPCEEAVQRPAILIDRRQARDPAHIPCFGEMGAKWYEQGTNHRLEDGMIARDFNAIVWCVDVDGPEDFLEFCKEHEVEQVYLSQNLKPQMWYVHIG